MDYPRAYTISPTQGVIVIEKLLGFDLPILQSFIGSFCEKIIANFFKSGRCRFGRFCLLFSLRFFIRKKIFRLNIFGTSLILSIYSLNSLNIYIRCVLV